jgi:hypothetical protein
MDTAIVIAPIPLVVDSIPSGARAVLPDGPSCYTPCELSVVPRGPFKVIFDARGYEPQTVEVTLAVDGPKNRTSAIRFEPNPVVAELTPSPETSARPGARPPASRRPRNSAVGAYSDEAPYR